MAIFASMPQIWIWCCVSKDSEPPICPPPRETDRIVRGGKRGAIPVHVAPILNRLHLDLDAWMSLMERGRSFLRAG